MPKPSNFKIVLSFIVAPVISWAKYWLIFTTVVTYVIFVLVASGFGQLPATFFTGLVTLDSLLIGVTGLVASMIMISLDLPKVQKSFETTTTEEGPVKWVKEMLSLAVATGPLFLIMLAVMPYFISAVIALVGMLMPEGVSLVFAAVAFWITLGTFLSIVSVLWKTVIAFWGGQKENVRKLLEYAVKKYSQSKLKLS